MGVTKHVGGERGCEIAIEHELTASSAVTMLRQASANRALRKRVLESYDHKFEEHHHCA